MGPQPGAQIRAAGGEQAAVGDAVGGDAQPVAVAAERGADRGHSRQQAAAIAVAPAAGGAVGFAAQGLQGPAGADAAHHLGGGDHLGGIPAVAVAHIHVFDQPQLQPPLPGQGRQGQQLVGVVVAGDHGVELQLAGSRIKARRPGVVDGRQHFGQQGFAAAVAVVRLALRSRPRSHGRRPHDCRCHGCQCHGCGSSCRRRQPRHAGDAGAIGTVEAEGDPLQSRLAQGHGPLGAQQAAVAGQGDLAQPTAVIALRPLAQRRQGANQCLQIRVQQRFAAGEPQGVDAEFHGCFHHQQPLRQAQQTGGLLAIRQAVGAGQVAAGRQRQPQHPEGPVVADERGLNHGAQARNSLAAPEACDPTYASGGHSAVLCRRSPPTSSRTVASVRLPGPWSRTGKWVFPCVATCATWCWRRRNTSGCETASWRSLCWKPALTLRQGGFARSRWRPI